MTKRNIFTSNSNIDFIQLKLYDFSDEKIDQEKIISERLNKIPNFENTNQKLFLDDNSTFKYDIPICPVCRAHKIIKKGTITKKQTKYQWKKCGKKIGIYNNPLIGKNKQFLQEIMNKIPGIMDIVYFNFIKYISKSDSTVKNLTDLP